MKSVKVPGAWGLGFRVQHLKSEHSLKEQLFQVSEYTHPPIGSPNIWKIFYSQSHITLTQPQNLHLTSKQPFGGFMSCKEEAGILNIQLHIKI